MIMLQKQWIILVVQDAIDHCIIIRWLQKFHLVCNNLNDQARSGKPKNMDSKAVLKVTKANLASSNLKVSGGFNIIHHFHDLSTSIHSYQIVPHVTKILQNLYTHPSNSSFLKFNKYIRTVEIFLIKCSLASQLTIIKTLTVVDKKWSHRFFLFLAFWTISLLALRYPIPEFINWKEEEKKKKLKISSRVQQSYDFIQRKDVD